MAAKSPQGLTPSRGLRAFGLQLAEQSPQNVHSPFEKSTTGYPPRAFLRMDVGQASMQSSQPVQMSWKSFSGIAQGGRNTGEELPKALRNKSARLNFGAVSAIVPTYRLYQYSRKRLM